LLAEAQVGSRLVVVAEVIRQRGLEMARVPNDKVVQTLSANRADEPLSIWILPGTLKGCQHFRDAQRLNAQSNVIAVNTVPVRDRSQNKGSCDVESLCGFAEDGILCAPTAFGKTAVAARLIAARNVPALVLVHRQQLLDQLRERLAMFLGVATDDIGQVGGGKSKRTGRIDVAVIQSLHHNQEVKDFVAEYGHVVVDECHHLSAFTFEKVMREVKARYVVGLTATPTRKDGHHPIIFMQCGPIRYRMNPSAMTESAPFEHVVVPRITDFHMRQEEAEITIQDVYSGLPSDKARNEMIVADLVHAVRCGRTPLLLTGRTEHLAVFADKLTNVVDNVFVRKGGMGRKQRRDVASGISRVPENKQRVILATGSYIGEGFDDARLDTLFLAMPISWKGTLQQYVGRLHRLHDSKRVVEVYDYVDPNVRMLARMYERRLKGYADMGYKILESDPSQHRLLM
jgi:superfamily II DNA or RNA helicase